MFGYGVRFSVDIGFDTVSLIIKEHEGFQCMLILLKLKIHWTFNGGCLYVIHILVQYKEWKISTSLFLEVRYGYLSLDINLIQFIELYVCI